MDGPWTPSNAARARTSAEPHIHRAVLALQSADRMTKQTKQTKQTIGLALGMMIGVGCGILGGGGGGGDDTGGLDWYDSSCSALGGVVSPSGACFIECAVGTSCDIPAAGAPEGYEPRCGGNEYHPYCSIGFCTSDADCGPDGWICDFGGCFLPCTEPTTGPSGECPGGLSCHENAISGHPSFCINDDGGGGTCGEPCASGCCSPSGLICCAPPFCGGDCVGSPCCS
jgi:hypothetical protein